MKNWLSAKDLQYELHVSRSTAYRILDNVPTVRVGRCLRVTRADLAQAMRVNGGMLPTSPTKEGRR